MTTEEIEKAAEEYTQKFVDKIQLAQNYESAILYAIHDFIKGAEFANKHWQEKTRWIPVEERLPPRGTETRQVFVKNIRTYKLNWTIISCFDDFYLDDVEFITRNFTHWKEIE